MRLLPHFALRASALTGDPFHSGKIVARVDKAGSFLSSRSIVFEFSTFSLCSHLSIFLSNSSLHLSRVRALSASVRVLATRWYISSGDVPHHLALAGSCGLGRGACGRSVCGGSQTLSHACARVLAVAVTMLWWFGSHLRARFCRWRPRRVCDFVVELASCACSAHGDLAPALIVKG